MLSDKRTLTSSLIFVISGFFVVATYFPNLTNPPLQEQLFLIRRAILSDGAIHGVATGEWYRLATVALTHGGWTHLIFNMLALLSVGTPASGAIFGLFAAMLVTGKRMGVDYRSVGGVIVVNLIITFTIPGIDWHAHLGGLAGGALVTYLIKSLK